MENENNTNQAEATITANSAANTAADPAGSNFKPITTQEEFDSRIAKRIARAQQAVRNEFADYEDLKGKLAGKDTEIDGYKTQIQNLTSQIEGHKLKDLQRQVADEFGIPKEFASRLTGTTADELRTDAKSIASVFQQKNPAWVSPSKNYEAGNSDGMDGYRAMLADFTK